MSGSRWSRTDRLAEAGTLRCLERTSPDATARCLPVRLGALKPEVRAWSVLLRDNAEASRRFLLPEINLPIFSFMSGGKENAPPSPEVPFDVSVMDWLAARYERSLQEIKEQNDRNFSEAMAASDLLRKAVAAFRSHENSARDLDLMLNKLPDMFASVESLIGTAVSLRRQLVLMDHELDRFAMKLSERELQSWMAEQDAALERYENKRRREHSAQLARLKAEEERRICAEEARKAARLQEEFEKQIEEYRQTGAIYGDGNGSASSAEARPRNDAVSPSAPHTVWQKGKAALLGDRVALPTPAADPLSELDDFLKDVDKDEVLASTPRRSGTDGNCDSSPRQDVMIAKDEDYADDGSLQ